MIVQGSQLCEQVETMISFLVVTESDTPEQTALSVGQKLCSLAMKCAPVALGVVIWAREFTQGRDYAASASFPTISPSILSLVRLVAMKHPFARADALHIALAFLGHSNSEISYQKVNSIKEASLRLLLFLLTKGDVVPVFSNLLIRVRKVDSSELDASLIRYFVGGVLEIAHAPVSPVFIRMFGRFLNTPRVMDAVRSSYFADVSRKRLANLVLSFKGVRLFDGSPLNKEDEVLVMTLLATYPS
jgi:TH1 protein